MWSMQRARQSGGERGRRAGRRRQRCAHTGELWLVTLPSQLTLCGLQEAQEGGFGGVALGGGGLQRGVSGIHLADLPPPLGGGGRRRRAEAAPLGAAGVTVGRRAGLALGRAGGRLGRALLLGLDHVAA